jgi:hypothetical protein
MECLNAMILYRNGVVDPEPNWEWEIDLYRKALAEIDPWLDFVDLTP